MIKIFFKENNILNVKESDLVTFILKNFGDSLFRNLKIPFAYKAFPNVRAPFINIGDLDLLLVNPKQPQFTYEIEFKRIKIKSDLEFGINKLNGLKIAVEQMKKRLKIGFHKYYLFIVSVFYGEYKQANNIFFKKADIETLDKIYGSQYLKELDDKVGIVGLEIVQPTAKNFNEQCGMSISKIQDSIPQRQPLSLTDLIAKQYCQ